MLDKTVNEVKEMLDEVAKHTMRPSGKYTDYWDWYGWRQKAVTYAIIEYALKLFEWGYDVCFCNDGTLHFLFAEKNKIVGYLQYESLLHSYSNVSKYFSNDEDMHIISDKEETDRLLSRPYANNKYKSIKEIPVSNNYIHIVK